MQKFTQFYFSLRFGVLLFVWGATFGGARDARAWGDLGHQTVGEIAEQNLTPEGKHFVFDILGSEPLAVAAIWPDLVRSDERFFEFAPYHFLEIPFDKTFATLPADQRARKGAQVIVGQSPGLLASQAVSKSQKVIWLRYLVHVVGDVHQPLHVGNGVDMGANLCTVRFTAPGSSRPFETNLHSVWDEKILEYAKADFLALPENKGKQPWFGYKQLVKMILSLPIAGSDEIRAAKNSPPVEWYNESQKLHSSAYFDKSPVSSPELRPYCKRVVKSVDDQTGKTKSKVVEGAFDATKVPVLDEAYGRKALAIAESQLLKGGLRLAALINDLAQASGGGVGTATEFIDLLSSVKIENEQGKD